jgi:hypothetical protein
VSKAQAAFFGAEYGRAKEGKETETGLPMKKLREFAGTKHKGLPRRVKPRSSGRR